MIHVKSAKMARCIIRGVRHRVSLKQFVHSRLMFTLMTLLNVGCKFQYKFSSLFE